MRIVSNTSPISNLAIIDQLDLLRERYGNIIIPPAVKAELDALSHSLGKSRIEAAFRAGWLSIAPVTEEAKALVVPIELDPGETEAIQLSLEMRADKLIIDDALGRAVARNLGLKITGLLGELIFAKRTGRIQTVRNEIFRLRQEARFFVSAEIEAMILSESGE